MRRRGTARAGPTRPAACGRKSTWPCWRRTRAFFKWDCSFEHSLTDSCRRNDPSGGGIMAFTFKGLLGAGAGRGQILSEADLEEPPTQVKMSGAARGYDPLAAPSIMDQMRSVSPEMKQPGRLWFIGHLP